MVRNRTFRNWLSGWLQARRRKRQQPALPVVLPNAPEIVGGDFLFEATAAAVWDVYIDWAFDHGSFPVAQMEVWVSLDNWEFNLLTTVSSNDPGYYYALAAYGETLFKFKVRYRNGATIGPFSNEYAIDIQI